MEKKIPLIVIAGPTASGKTRLAIELAIEYNGEIVSADSMQIYKGLQIATAKPTEVEMQGIKHHLIDFLEPEQSFNVADYVKMATQIIMDIYSRGKMPIVCGGTGLYISSLVDGIQFDETAGNPEIRDRLLKELEENGNRALWEKLLQVDEETALKVHENNVNRVIRALEVYELTGVKLSEHKVNSRREKSPFASCVIGLGFEDRQVLYDRINKRVDIMLEDGLLDEVKQVYDKHNLKTAYQAIGYKEFVPYFEGESDLNTCVDKIKQETRRYAKRQLTWFRRVDGIVWVEVDKIDKYKNFIENVKNIIAKSEIMCYNII